MILKSSLSIDAGDLIIEMLSCLFVVFVFTLLRRSSLPRSETETAPAGRGETESVCVCRLGTLIE